MAGRVLRGKCGSFFNSKLTTPIDRKLRNHFFNQRKFSDYAKKGNNSLLQALKVDSGKKNRGNDKGHGRTSGEMTMYKDTKQRMGKKLTLDEFFANMNKRKYERNENVKNELKILNIQHKSSTRSANHKPSKESLAGTLSRLKLSTSEKENKDNESPYDEIDALIRRGKLREEKEKKQMLCSSPGSDLKTHTSYLQSTQSNRPSISDMLPPQLNEISSLFYDKSSYDKYLLFLDEIIRQPKFLRKHTKSPLEGSQAESVIHWLRAAEPVVDIKLPSLRNALRHDEDVGSKTSYASAGKESETKDDCTIDTAAVLRNELVGQREIFMKHHNWTKKQYSVAMRALSIIGNLCAKQATALPLNVGWEKMKEAGHCMDKNTIHTYLYVASTFLVPFARRRLSFTSKSSGFPFDFLGDSSKPVVDRTPFENTLPKNITLDDTADEFELSEEVAVCHDLLYHATEQSTGIRIRMLVLQGKVKEAEQLLDKNADNEEYRLRTYAPIYQAYLEQNDVTSALKVFTKMKQTKNTIMVPEIYVQLIACIAENGYFRKGAKEIEGCTTAGYTEGCGPTLFDELASELASNTIEITAASAKRLYNAFQNGFELEDNFSRLKPMHVLESFKKNNEPATSSELIVSRVTINANTGICPRSGTQLRLINLDANQKRQYQRRLIELCSSTYEERHKKTNPRIVQEMIKFGSWLEGHTRQAFTAILDGPNIAYYMQNFDGGRFNYHQIKFVLDTLESMGENVLVVLPQKYAQVSFMLSKQTGFVRQRLTVGEKRILDDLISNEKVYIVPSGSVDDFYWMYASVSMSEDYIPPGNLEGRWPGKRPMLISNDKLRDHRMALIEPRLFRRWYSNYLVNFTFSAFVGDECIDREIGFRTADIYSHEIQGNVFFDRNGKEVGTTWHFPVAGWDEGECLCIRIPNSDGSQDLHVGGA